jgi:peroxiredoxin family protein
MAEDNPQQDKFTLVLSSDDLDKALAAFIMATTAASMGMEVTMFFTFWGLNVIKRNDARVKPQGFIRGMMNIINRGGSRRLKLSKFDMLGLGTWMMKKLMKENKMPSLDELIDMARDLGVKMVPCTTTCGLMGMPDEVFRAGVMDRAGAAFFLGVARESRITLFI